MTKMTDKRTWKDRSRPTSVGDLMLPAFDALMDAMCDAYAADYGGRCEVKPFALRGYHFQTTAVVDSGRLGNAEHIGVALGFDETHLRVGFWDRGFSKPLWALSVPYNAWGEQVADGLADAIWKAYTEAK